ncbi:MAG TPA: hypothetical protein VMU95_32945 [Trebonia sp.]|nr:hypothetical protein [Trebonia sp.]
MTTPRLAARRPWVLRSGLPKLRPGFTLEAATPDRRRALQLVLGGIWLLDAALQYQPFMFTEGFVSQIIQVNTTGNPAVIADPITWSAGVMAQHILVYNAMFATLQLLIAVGLLYRPTVKVALAMSILWAVAVWWIGEGLGDILTGSASPAMGAPGSAIIYALLALLAWPTELEGARPSRVTALTRPDGAPAQAVWALLWGSLAGFALLPANRSPSTVAAMLSGMQAGEPGWIRALDRFLSNVLGQHATLAAITIAVLCLLVAAAIISKRLDRAAVIIAVILGAAFWVTEDFGAIFTGQGTDPGSGPVLIVLAAAFWPSARKSGGREREGRIVQFRRDRGRAGTADE